MITKEEDRKKLKTVTKYAFNAPMYFLVCCDKNKVWKHQTEDYYSTEIDGTISVTHIILEAHDLGLGSVVVRSFQTEKIKEDEDNFYFDAFIQVDINIKIPTEFIENNLFNKVNSFFDKYFEFLNVLK